MYLPLAPPRLWRSKPKTATDRQTDRQAMAHNRTTCLPQQHNTQHEPTTRLLAQPQKIKNWKSSVHMQLKSTHTEDNQCLN